MKAIQYIKLFTYLRDIEELEGIQIFRTINRVRKLPKEFLIEIDKILDGKEPNLVVEGVSYEQLREKDGMRPIRAILFLDWVRTEPEAAFSYMAESAHRRAPIQPLNKDEKEELDAAIERLKKQVKEVPQPEPEIDKSEDDIVINDPIDNEKEVSQPEPNNDKYKENVVIDDSHNNAKETPQQEPEIDKANDCVVKEDSAEKETGTHTDKQEV